MKRAVLLALILTSLFSIQLLAQDITIVASGLRSPVGIDSDQMGNFYVAQAGTGQNDGEVTLMTPDGELTPLVVDLPSFFDTMTNEVIGTFRAQALERPYFIVFNAIGRDDSGPAAFLFNLNDFIPGEPLTLADAIGVFEIGAFVLGEGIEESNPYSMVHDGCDWFVADAAANAIVRRDGLTGQYSIFAEFPSFPNPLPFGPPFVHPVPTRIISDQAGGFYVSSLTGFPFISGASNIWHVNAEGEVNVHEAGFTLVTDIALDRTDGSLITLQFAEFDLMQMPPFVFGSAKLIDVAPGGERDTLAEGFGPSAGMVVAGDGIIYVTELLQGNVLRIDTETTGLWDPTGGKQQRLTLAPNPANTFVEAAYSVPYGDHIRVKIFDLSGKLVAQRELGYRDAGFQTERIALDAWLLSGVSSQAYYVKVEGAGGWSFDNMLVVTK